MSKYIFVTGGVVSSVGKGISVASIGRLLKSRGISIIIAEHNIGPFTGIIDRYFIMAEGMTGKLVKV